MANKRHIAEYLDVDLDAEMWCCNRCGNPLTSAYENYKHGCVVYERDPKTVYRPVTGKDFDYSPDPDWQVIVEFYCPNCGVMIDCELLPPGHPVTWDIQLDIARLRARAMQQKGA